MQCKHLEDKENINQPIEKHRGTYAINGCCGGGCYIIQKITHCPFCGEKLK